MKRFLYVLIIAGFAVSLACAPASRKQAVQKTGSPGQQNVKPQPSPSPTDGTTPSDGTQPPTAPGNGTGSTGSGSTDTSKSSASSGSFIITRVDPTFTEQGGFNLKFQTQDGETSKTPQVVISVDSSGKVTEGQGTSDSKFTCADASVTKVSDCVDAQLSFTYQSQSILAKINKVTDLQVDERIEISKDGLFKADPTKVKDNVGSAYYTKVVLSYGTSKVLSIRATFVGTGFTVTKHPDDIQVSNDSNLAIRVFGLPSVDSQNKPIETTVSKNDKKAPTPVRQMELKPIIDPNHDDFIRYSVGIILPVDPKADKTKLQNQTQALVLIAHPGATSVSEGDGTQEGAVSGDSGSSGNHNTAANQHHNSAGNSSSGSGSAGTVDFMKAMTENKQPLVKPLDFSAPPVSTPTLDMLFDRSNGL